MSDEQAKTVIHTHITNKLDYNNSLLMGCPKKVIRRMQLVQNAAARVITGCKKKDHVTPILHQLHWLPVEYRIVYKVLLLTFKVLNGKGPEYLRELLTVYVPGRSLRSETDNLLCVPRTKYVETQKRAFGVQAALQWNKLPVSLRHTDTVDSFKKALKTHLFKHAYD